MRHTLRLSNRGAVPATALQVLFVKRRGRLELRNVRPTESKAALRSRTLRIRFAEPVAPHADVSIELDYEGETPASHLHEFEAFAPAEWMAVEGNLGQLKFATHETHKAEIFEWRAAHVGGEFAREQTFFNVFDERTWDEDADQRGLLDLFGRMLAARRDGDPVDALGAQASEDVLRRFSSVFVESAKATLGDPADPATVVALQDAFDRFAKGELSLLGDGDGPADPLFHEFKARACQPDSTFHFYFAEFASTCIERGVDPVLWRALLPTLVQDQKFLFQTYEDGGGDPIRHGQLLGGRWPAAVPTSVDELHTKRAAFLAGAWSTAPEAVRTNYALQFVDL